MTEEEVQRLETSQATERSYLDVLQYGSGFSGQSISQQLYREEFERLQQEEVDWLKLVGQSKYDAAKATQKAYKYQGISSLVSAGFGAATSPIGTGGSLWKRLTT